MSQPLLPVMTVLVLLLATAAGCRSGGQAHANTQPSGFRIVDPNAQAGPLPALLRRELASAKAAGLRPYIEVGAPWCAPCRRLKASLGDERMQAAFKGTYIIRLDYDQWNEQLGAAGFRVKTIPVFFEIDATGHPTGESLDGEAWAQDTPADMAPVLRRFFDHAS